MIFDPHSSVVKSVFDCCLSGVEMVLVSKATSKGIGSSVHPSAPSLLAYRKYTEVDKDLDQYTWLELVKL